MSLTAEQRQEFSLNGAKTREALKKLFKNFLTWFGVKWSTRKKTEGICEMSGHHVGVRQKAHIFAECKKVGVNLLMICPSCHIMFDTHLKPKIFKALVDAGVRGLPRS
jgi:hypothetical protein